MNTRIGPVLAALALLACAHALPAAARPSAPAAHAAALANCRLTPHEQQTFGPTYVTSLKVHGTSCAAGKAVVRAFQRCRRAHGIAGRCTTRVKGYACRENRSTIASQFTSKVTCADGRRRVVHTYTQNT